MPVVAVPPNREVHGATLLRVPTSAFA
jgi:hypothetical protein